jgi:hypothetical protein
MITKTTGTAKTIILERLFQGYSFRLKNTHQTTSA